MSFDTIKNLDYIYDQEVYLWENTGRRIDLGDRVPSLHGYSSYLLKIDPAWEASTSLPVYLSIVDNVVNGFMEDIEGVELVVVDRYGAIVSGSPKTSPVMVAEKDLPVAFVIRPGKVVTFALPVDVTKDEVARLCRMLEMIPVA